VTVDPSTDRFFGHVQVGASSISNAGNAGYDVRGAVNVPLSDTWAARASAFYRQDPGYIDNPVLGLEGINKSEAFGGHLSLLWKPSQDTSLKLSALVQHAAVFGSSQVDIQPGLGDLQQDHTPGSGRNDGTLQAYSAVFKQKLGNAELTSITGYSVDRYTNTIDLTNYYNGLQILCPDRRGSKKSTRPTHRSSRRSCGCRSLSDKKQSGWWGRSTITRARIMCFRFLGSYSTLGRL